MEEQEINIGKKLDSLSSKKKMLLLSCLLLILGSLYYMTTVDVIQIFEYNEHGVVVCTEKYVNGVLNTTPCPQNTNYFPKKTPYILSNFSLNFKNGTTS